MSDESGDTAFSIRGMAVWILVCFLLGATIAGAAVHLTNSSSASGTTPIGTSNGFYVYVTGDKQIDLRDPQSLSSTVNVITESGNATFYSAGPSNLTVDVDDLTGQWTNVTNVDADPDAIQIDPADKPVVWIGQEIDSFAYTGSYGVDDGTVDFVYSGTSGVSEVTIQGVPTNQQLAAVDANTGDILDAATSDSNGLIIFDSLTNSQHNVLLQTVDFEGPTLSNPSPTGGQTSEPSTISIDVNDTEFDQGDTVDVTIELDGSQIHTTTISSNQTVSASIPASGKTSGQHDWRVNATDSFGETAIESYSYSVPDTLYVRNATNHTQLIKTPISVDGTFFGTDAIFERNGITDGTISMNGLPVTDDYIVEVVPSNENLTTRSLYLDSIFQQESIYLLNTSAYPTVETRFTLDDPTGEYGPQSVLFIQRPINISGSTNWQTVHSDEFGAEGVTSTLEEGQRYRIRVRNNEGDEQLIGPYRADVSETVTVQPGTPSVSIDNFEEGWGANAVLDNRTLQYRYSDPAQETDSVTVWIHEKNNQTNRLQANQTYFDLGNFSASASLTQNESEKTWVVNFIVDRNGEEFVKRVEVSNRADVFPGLPDPWGPIIGIGLLLMLAGAFSILNAKTGAVVVASVGGVLWYIGLMGGATSAAGIVLGLFVAVLAQLYSSAGP